uniref:Monoterpene synthase 11 n=1 Tax=Salvia officinalis TaxID=38868 RepID=A0A6M6CEQ2_SALOF|nr:monoterpene synthase 11 [Salvia officinalis]
MCSIIMGMAIPMRPTKDVFHNFGKKDGKMRLASPTCGRRPTCSLKLSGTVDQLPSTRRSGNYRPTLWDFDDIQSLNSVYAEEKYSIKACELVVQLKKVLQGESNWVRQLELIHDLQTLGISYHFDHEINQILNSIYLEQKYLETEERDLYSTALAFRLLRQHGLRVSQDVFDCLKNEEGELEAVLGDNTKGVLQLYEASFLLTEGEMSLEQARVFSTNFLQKKLDDDEIMDEHLSWLVRRSLELPLHWSVQRPNARWFIDACANRSDVDPILLELAKLDFNIVQAAYQQELKEVSRWWKESKLAETLPFARDRVVENYLWNVGLLFQPQYGYPRIMTTKLFILITVIDDIFDVYGTLEETQLFNDAILRWDVEAIGHLPKYMQICYMALDNFINEMAYHVLIEQGVLIVQDLRKSYELQRGDVPKAVECYMNETGASVEEAREHVKCMLRETWMKTNEESFKECPIFSKDFMRSAADLGRHAQYMYQHGDGHGISNPQMEERIRTLIFQPIPLL